MCMAEQLCYLAKFFRGVAEQFMCVAQQFCYVPEFFRGVPEKLGYVAMHSGEFMAFFIAKTVPQHTTHLITAAFCKFNAIEQVEVVALCAFIM